jgi:hypothetical protein
LDNGERRDFERKLITKHSGDDVRGIYNQMKKLCGLQWKVDYYRNDLG